MAESTNNYQVNESFHRLSDRWTLWAHLPHKTDWSMKSYIKIYYQDIFKIRFKL